MKTKPEGVVFFVAGKPMAQPRQRHRIVVVGKEGDGKQASRRKSKRNMYVQTYNPANSEPSRWKRKVRAEAAEAFRAYRLGPFDGPVMVRLLCRFALKSKPCHYREKKPDIDNLQKLVFDAMNGVAYRDDSQICRVTASKTETRDPALEGVVIRVVPLVQRPAEKTDRPPSTER